MTKIRKEAMYHLEMLGFDIAQMLKGYNEEAREIILSKIKSTLKVL